MILAQYRRDSGVIFATTFKLICDQHTRIVFICLVNLFLGQIADTWNFPVNIIRMRGSITWNITPRLCPACCPGRMGMYNTANLRETIVKYHMSSRIRRRIIASFYFITLQVNNNHILRCQQIIFYSARFDNKQTRCTVNAADISPGKCHKAIVRKHHICLINLFL